MARKNRSQHVQTPSLGVAKTSADKPATLKELLSAEVLAKLKKQQAELEAAETQRREEKRRQEEEARKAEQKRLENDFEYLLNNSDSDWRKYK
jgi:hypothetical protein